MAFTSGVATDYLDLLNRLKQFVTQDMLPANERWSVLHWKPGPPAELVLQGPGLAGTDQINVGIRSVAGADYGNWELRGYVAWNPALPFDSQYKQSKAYYAMLMQSAMPYWIVANGRRIVMVAKTSTYYEMMYLGLFLPYATPAQYPYPLLIAGSYNQSVRYSETGYRYSFTKVPSSYSYCMSYYTPAGTWKDYMAIWPYDIGDMRECPDGSYPLLPVIIDGLGEVDGVYVVPGYQNASENIITVDGVNYLVVQNVNRTGYNDYSAVKLA